MPDLTQLANINRSIEDIPSRRYFTIGEVAKLCLVKPHVLRYWEQEFPQLKPSKRRGNRRYYQYKDVVLIKKIYELLYNNGYTISGARQWIVQSGKAHERPAAPAIDIIQDTILDLNDILRELS